MSVSVSVGSNRSEAKVIRSVFLSQHEYMSNNGDAGEVVVTSVEYTEGHETMDENQISDVGITTGHGTFVTHR